MKVLTRLLLALALAALSMAALANLGAEDEESTNPDWIAGKAAVDALEERFK